MLNLIIKTTRRQAYLNAAHALKTKVNVCSASNYIKARYINAIDSAIRLHERGFVVLKKPGHFAVKSEHGEHEYLLNIEKGKISCNCAAGQTKMPCKHAALVALFNYINHND